ncbi:DNA polymerase alpha accessory factor Mcl1 [Didymosphaeria variabile]|uniref:DNA polymerase alpha accessory factor Mcl1 n=1 Tax=Didymosphaeria variabile TaxID=1932322 RepID=A0A9W8XFP4_9PLEO|nr:DNA polymerase alpha accessory factor Mcl1 [Didymosphaeria variabile]KAJ4348784.1 DNA polymerase alpha accessory factor Mcl1 [Didymosphaeria variabile]
MATPQQLRGRYAHAPGPTFLAYTPNGNKLITAGVDNFCRVFTTGSDGEPSNIDDCQENNLSIAAGDGFFITGAEDGTVNKYSIGSSDGGDILWRSTLPVRDVALSPDGQWVAVASDELVVYIINTKDIQIVKRLRDQNRSVKHVSFNKGGTQLAVSCVDGSIYIYSIDSEQPKLVQKVDDMIKRLEPEAESSAKVLWHPDGRAFATPTALREVQVMSTNDWEKQKTFKTEHTSDITAVAWSPNGALLATTSSDLTLCLWDAKTQSILKKYDDIKATILAMAWHPTENILSYTNTEGHLYIHTDFVPQEHEGFLQKPVQPAPFFHDPSEGRSNDPTSKLTNGTKHVLPERRARAGSADSLDDLLGDEFRDDDEDMPDEADDGFVIDDDGAGYTNGHGKRTNGHLEPLESISKRRPTAPAFQPQIHEPFQPGGTPWRGNRRLLCCSLIGYVSTISQEGTHYTAEVKFYDEQAHHNFKFTDVFGYDKAALTEHGTLFSCQPKDDTPAMIYYRPHETWTNRADWRTNLPADESITAIALSESYVVVTTSANYVRIYSLFGLPIRVYRQKASPTVTCAAWRDYVLTIGNGPVGGDGTSQLLYTIENVKRDEIYQSEDIVALPPNTTLTSVFFSADGDPYIYDSDGVLLTLLHWRTNGQARWVPMLDTKCLSRRAGGGKQESYWPVCVSRDADGKHVFHCMIIKGSEKHPTNPPPMLSEFALEIPLSSSIDKSREGKDRDVDAMFDDEEDSAAKKPENKQQQHEQDFVLSSALHAQLSDSLSHTRPTAHQKQDLVSLEVQIDRSLLQLLGLECLAGEDRGMKALELVTLMHDANGKMLDLAGKVAQRYGRDMLGEKIQELAEKKLLAGAEEEEDF